MEKFFNPKSVAIIGASHDEEKVGGVILKNIIQYGFKGKIFPVNPKYKELKKYKCYSSISDIPEDIDLAIFIIPAKFIPKILEECGQKGVQHSLIISAGFKEIGPEGIKLEQEILKIAKSFDMRIWGPNCLGLIDTTSNFNASFAGLMPIKGEIALISQSGALCTAILDWSINQGIGFSKVISMGNKADLNESDFLEAVAQDSNTKVIICYLENVVNGKRFIEVATRVSKFKPIVAIKAGVTQAGARAASSHTGSLAGSRIAYETVFKKCGILSVNSVEELFDIASAFVKTPIPNGRKIAILTNAGGVGILTADAIEKSGLYLAELSSETLESLQDFLPPASNFYNPVDILGDAQSDRYEKSLDILLQDKNVNGAIVCFTPQAMSDVEVIAQKINLTQKKYNKTVLGCFMGENSVSKGIKILRDNNVPNYSFPERAVNTFLALSKRFEWLNLPEDKSVVFSVDKDKVEHIINESLSSQKYYLGGIDAKEIMLAYNIKMPEGGLAKSSDEAVLIAEKIGYPVVMKIVSPEIKHKTDVGGVKTGIKSADEIIDIFDLMLYRVKKYYPEAEITGISVEQQIISGREVILGMNVDPQFGPLIMFGLGGIYVEVLKDVSFRVPPISLRDVKEMVAEIKTFELLLGARGEKLSDLEAIYENIFKLAQLALDFPQIIEMDINPLKVGYVGKGAVALDVRLTLKANTR
ncbi:MAG: acetate--CoA ligase alpha subunit [Candidatus Firestonebacteria bacterium]